MSNLLFIKKTYDPNVSWSGPAADLMMPTDLGKISLPEVDEDRLVYSPEGTKIDNWMAGVESFYFSFGGLPNGPVYNFDTVSLGCGVDTASSSVNNTGSQGILSLSPYLQLSGTEPGSSWLQGGKFISLEGKLLLTISVVLTYS